MDTETVVSVVEYPTTQQQLVTAGISVLTAAAVVTVTYGTMFAIEKIGTAIEKRKTAKKAAKEIE